MGFLPHSHGRCRTAAFPRSVFSDHLHGIRWRMGAELWVLAMGPWPCGPERNGMIGWDSNFCFFWGTWDLFFVLFRMGIFCQHSDIIRCWSAVDCNIVTHGFLSEHQAAVAARPTDSGWHAEHAIRGFQEIGSSDHTSYQLAIYFPYKTPAIV